MNEINILEELTSWKVVLMLLRYSSINYTRFFYSWTAAEHAQTILFFLSQNYDFSIKDMTFILPLLLVLFYPVIDETMCLKRFFFFFSQLKSNEFSGAGEIENKKHWRILYHSILDFLFKLLSVIIFTDSVGFMMKLWH